MLKYPSVILTSFCIYLVLSYLLHWAASPSPSVLFESGLYTPVCCSRHQCGNCWDTSSQCCNALIFYSARVCVCVCVCVVLCVKVSKCFLTEASSLSVNKWVGHSHDLHFILYVSLFLPLNCSTFLHIQSIYTCPSLSRHKEHQCLLYNVFPSQHACSEVPPALILKK